MSVLETLTRVTDPALGITIVHTWFGEVTKHTFRTAPEAMRWIEGSIYGHLEDDMSVGQTVRGHVIGEVFFSLTKTDGDRVPQMIIEVPNDEI